MAISDCFVSVVAPLSNDGAIIDEFVRDVMAVLRATYANYELVLVDDGSDDNTVLRLAPLLGELECIRLIRLSRRFGEEIAIFAGLDAVIGDFTVVMLPNWDPPMLIPEIVARARRGSEVVFGVTENRGGESFFVRIGSAVFDWYCSRVLKLDLPKNSTQFRVLSRQVVNAVTQVKNSYRYLRVLTANVGFQRESFLYQPINRRRQPGRTGFLDAVAMATDIMVTSSRHPLRFASWLGVMAATVNMLYAGYIVAVYLFKNDVAEGWTTLSMQNAVMFFFVFLIMTVTSEYIGHILVETIDRPLYYVLEERTSSVLIADEGRKNVVYESAARASGEPERRERSEDGGSS